MKTAIANSVRHFKASRSGNIATMFAMTLVPLGLAAGLTVDYRMASNARSGMQNALDAAVIAAAALPNAATLEARESKLDAVYAANSHGDMPITAASARITSVTLVNSELTVLATATYTVPTGFMRLANVVSAPVDVSARALKTLKPVRASFKLDRITGWWDKNVTLYGQKVKGGPYLPLMQIVYRWNGKTGGDAIGTTTIVKFRQDYEPPKTTAGLSGILDPLVSGLSSYAVDKILKIPSYNADGTINNENTVKIGETATKSCLTASGAQSTNKQDCKLTNGSDQTEISLAGMNDIYLQMDIIPPDQQGFANAKNDLKSRGSKFPLTIRSNDPSLSSQFFVGPKNAVNLTPVPQGQTADVFSKIGCDEERTQAWEDGGNFSQQDLYYNVVGKCDDKEIKSLALTK